MADPFENADPQDAIISVLRRAQIIAGSIEKVLEDQKTDPGRQMVPHEFAELVEGIGVFKHLHLLCEKTTGNTLG